MREIVRVHNRVRGRAAFKQGARRKRSQPSVLIPAVPGTKHRVRKQRGIFMLLVSLEARIWPELTPGVTAPPHEANEKVLLLNCAGTRVVRTK